MSDSHTANLNALNAADIDAWRNFLDLQVLLVVELGRTKMSMRDVLNLELNSIIQLQRSTAEGVDVLASGLYIARGEIITIEDRTGVRINEVIMSKRRH